MAYANKKISITGYASSICNTDSIILTAPAGFTTYNWSNGKLQSQVAINTPGFYSVIFTDSAGCKVMDSTTLLFTKGPCYEGIYTIGGVNPDFLSVKAAMDSLNKYRIKGKVTFRIRNGVYNDRLVLHSIKGASLTNNVTFESESGFAPKVVITADDTLLYLDNVSFLTIKNITFKDTIHERFIYCPYTYGTYLNFIENNFIGNGDDNYYYTNRSNTIVGFTSSHYGVYFTTSSAIDSSSFVGNVFSHTFSNILFYTIGYSQISNNKFSAYKYALVLANGYYCTISGNKVEIINGNEGISCSGSYLSIFNNRVICKNPSGSPSSVSALRIASGNNNKIYNNDLFSDKINNGSATLNITGKSCFIAHNNIIGSPAFYFTFTNNDSISVINNNFGLPSGGNILLTFKNSFGSIQAANIKEYKNNNYHGIDSTFDTYKMVTSSTTNYKTYSSWKNAQIFDNDSRFIDPKYISQYVLTPTNKSLNNTAEFSPEVQTDISGNWRNSPKTDIGSYEINTFKDLMVDSVFLPTSACIISGTTKIRIRNNSLFFKIYKNDSVRVSYSINGVSQPSSIFNFKKDSLDYYDTAIVSLPPLSSLLNTKVNDLKFWINYYSDSSSCNDTLLHTFYFPIPQVDFSSSGVCTGTNILFTSQTSQVIAYKWSFPDGSSAITPNAVSALNPGTNNITLQVTNMEGCNNSITKPIIIYNLPSNAVIRNGDSLIADTGLSYRWFLNNVALPADTFQKVKIKQSGNYKVVVTSPQGCVNTSSNAFYAATGINKLSLLNEVLIYPVPTKSAVQIEFSATEKIKYTLTDITGKVVQTGNFTNKYNELNLSFLKSGIYIISLQDTLGQTTTRKIVKE
ncbi:MAG: T9SS type A sorting domain-containing protein [Bacteroidia bacterium]|nr:T9SS type A sorting domain-containing protein [Bacteroidia bacterium]